MFFHLVEYSWNTVEELSIKGDGFASLAETYFCPFLIMKSENIQDKLDNLLTQRNEEYEIKEKIKNNEINIEDLSKYIINSNQKKKERKKKKKNKGKTKNKEQKNEIKTEVQEEYKDEVVDEFKKYITECSINNDEIVKIKPCISQEWINGLA